jgi:tRNA modification GTPase
MADGHSIDTIVALASGRGRAGVAVIRLSGPDAGQALRQVTGRPCPQPRRAALRTLRGADGEVLDQALTLWFPAPASFTGEDVAELHVHGGRAVIEGVLDALAARPAVRPAEAGEFTRRAFDNGRMDLTGAEGLADLVAAETAAQRRQALEQMGGALAARTEGWRHRLIETLAYLEACIDFSDEDIPADLERRVGDAVAELRGDIAAHLADGYRGERIRDGIRIAIIGAPNAGKSSLLNALARREAAIVSPQPGTTRDVIEVALDIAGYPVLLCDTAGIRGGGDAVEMEGVRRAREQARTADLRLAVIDGARWPDACAETRSLIDGETLVCVSKADLGRVNDVAQVDGHAASVVSVRTGGGISALIGRLEAALGERFGGGEAVSLTRLRHRQALEACLSGLDGAAAATEMETRAEELRHAATALGRITGRVDVEDLLDVIFGSFCIGK